MIKKTIYFICNGNSLNDIIRSTNELKKDTKKSFFNYIYQSNNGNDIKHKKIELMSDPSLIKLGIKELNILQENKDNRLFLQNFKRIYTSLDTCSIESVFVLYKNIVGTTIYPIPHMVTNRNISDTDTLNKFKAKFGKLNDNKTTVSSYWEKNYVNNIKKINTIINWNFINNINTKKTYLQNEKSIRSSFHYGFHGFEKELIKIIQFDPNDSILIVSNYNILKNILDRCSNKKFNSNKNNIEVSSLWKFEIEYVDNNIKFLTFEKKYPTTSNHKPLDYNENIDKRFRFTFNGINYILFNAHENIPVSYLKVMNNKNISHNIKNKLSKTNGNVNIVNNSKLISIDNFK
jgi:hypothetical protein